MQSLKNIYKNKCTGQSIIPHYSKNWGRENVLKFKITLTLLIIIKSLRNQNS